MNPADILNKGIQDFTLHFHEGLWFVEVDGEEFLLPDDIAKQTIAYQAKLVADMQLKESLKRTTMTQYNKIGNDMGHYYTSCCSTEVRVGSLADEASQCPGCGEEHFHSVDEDEAGRILDEIDAAEMALRESIADDYRMERESIAEERENQGHE